MADKRAAVMGAVVRAAVGWVVVEMVEVAAMLAAARRAPHR